MDLLFSGHKRHAKMMIAVIFALTSLLVFSSVAFAASWRTGNVPYNSNTSAITVTLSNQSKKAYIKVHGYVQKAPWDTTGKEKNCKFHVTMRDAYGNWIWEGDIKTGSGGKKLKLGNDHTVYKIYLKHINEGVHCWDPWHNCPDYWGVECVSNCSVQ